MRVRLKTKLQGGNFTVKSHKAVVTIESVQGANHYRVSNDPINLDAFILSYE